MTVAELIAELSKVEDQTIKVLHSDREFGDEDVDYVDLVADGYPFSPPTPYVRLW